MHDALVGRLVVAPDGQRLEERRVHRVGVDVDVLLELLQQSLDHLGGSWFSCFRVVCSYWTLLGLLTEQTQAINSHDGGRTTDRLLLLDGSLLRAEDQLAAVLVVLRLMEHAELSTPILRKATRRPCYSGILQNSTADASLGSGCRPAARLCGEKRPILNIFNTTIEAALQMLRKTSLPGWFAAGTGAALRGMRSTRARDY